MEGIQKYSASIGAVIRLLLLCFLIFLIIISFHTIIKIIFAQFISPTPEIKSILKMETYTINTYYTVTFFILFYFMNRRHNISWVDIFRFRTFPLFILPPLVSLLLGRLILYHVIKNAIDFSIPDTSNFNLLFPDNSFKYFSSAIFILLIGPLLEETLFRGIILEGFLNQYKPARALLYATLFFGLLHGPSRFFNTFICGLIYGYLYLNTRSLIPCILAHIFDNSMIDLVLLFLKLQGTRKIALQYIESPPLWLIGIGIMLFFVGFWVLVKFFNKQLTLNKWQWGRVAM